MWCCVTGLIVPSCLEQSQQSKKNIFFLYCWPTTQHHILDDVNLLLVSPISQHPLLLCRQHLCQFPNVEINTSISFHSICGSVCPVYTSSVSLAIMSFPLISSAMFTILEGSVSVIILLLVPSTSPPPPTPFLELPFWMACPDTSHFEADYPTGNIKILAWFCFSKFPFGLPSGDLTDSLHLCDGCSPLHCLCFVLYWVLFSFNMTLIRCVWSCERGER